MTAQAVRTRRSPLARNGSQAAGVQVSSEVGMSDWFDVHELDESTFVISEPMHVNSYLLVGSERAVLFDTGMGVADMRAQARALTDRPILAVNSHHHFDHVGGNAQFDDLAIHESGAALLEQGPPPGWLPSYWREYAEALSEYGVDPAASWWTGTPPRALPASFDVDNPPFVRSVPSRLLHDGEALDLGDRQVEVLHTPGHSADGICLLDRGHRILFSGDTVDSISVYLHVPTASVDDLGRSAGRLQTDAMPAIDAIVGGHSPTFRSDPDLIAELHLAVERVQSGDVELRPTVDCFGAEAREAVFDRLSLVLPLSAQSG
jgi:glyoxylase-like metal-dependent hydrolase (beta-lactamase superfamily II)